MSSIVDPLQDTTVMLRQAKAYPDYKSILGHIQTFSYGVSQGTKALVINPRSANVVELIKSLTEESDKEDNPETEKDASLADKIESIEGSEALTKPESKLVSQVPMPIEQAFAPALEGLEEARLKCRFMMNRIVQEIDNITVKHQIATDENKLAPYLSPFLFELLLPLGVEVPSEATQAAQELAAAKVNPDALDSHFLNSPERQSSEVTLTTGISEEAFSVEYSGVKHMPDSSWHRSLNKENTLKKGLLEDHRAESAQEGICSAAVILWLATGSIPPPTEKTLKLLAEIQGSGEVETEGNYLEWISNLSKFFNNLKPQKNSTGLNLKDRGTFSRLLTDNSGKINLDFKVFLILSFQNSSHAIGLNLRNNALFDPNKGVLKTQTGKDTPTNVAYSLRGMEEIRDSYGNVTNVEAIVFE
ncbi:hypothetical protein FSARC_14389 [Fusarium sarcochroum]|uniref:Uncharacterized protein n=1 Tax=Fusarium sarcochroum TaxID=1208366 RepID=A0A8H4SUA0_9HYPO|nr:hypothetical protein FSARC_14389 [Fusarium sarcochroum]